MFPAIRWVIVFYLTSYCVLAHASDLAKEKRWAEQIVDSLIDGDAVWLNADGQKFLGIYTPAAGQVRGGVVVMHGIGAHPNWAQVVYPLRVRLAEQGWSTLSIQMPILPNESEAGAYAPLFAEVPARITAAVNELEAQGVRPIFLVGHSLGATMTSYFLGQGGHPSVAGFVGIGMAASPTPEQANSESLKRITVPVLDLYGQHDLDDVIRLAEARRAAAESAGNRDFRQSAVADADHFFEGQDDALVQTVANWLAAHGGE